MRPLQIVALSTLLAFAWLATPELEVTVEANGNCGCNATMYGYGPGDELYPFCEVDASWSSNQPTDMACSSWCTTQIVNEGQIGECFAQCGPGDPPATPTEWSDMGGWSNTNNGHSGPISFSIQSC